LYRVTEGQRRRATATDIAGIDAATAQRHRQAWCAGDIHHIIEIDSEIKTLARGVGAVGWYSNARNRRSHIIHCRIASIGGGSRVTGIIGGRHRHIAIGGGDDSSSQGVAGRPGTTTVGSRDGCTAAKLREIDRDATDGIAVVIAPGSIVPGCGDGIANLENATGAAGSSEADIGICNRRRDIVDAGIGGIGGGGRVTGIIGDSERHIAIAGVDSSGGQGVGGRPGATAVARRDSSSTSELGKVDAGAADGIAVVITPGGIIPGRGNRIPNLEGTTGAAGAADTDSCISDGRRHIIHSRIVGISRSGAAITIGRSDRHITTAEINGSGGQGIGGRPSATAIAGSHGCTAAKLAEVHRNAGNAAVIIATGGVIPGGGDGITNLEGATGAAGTTDADITIRDRGGCHSSRDSQIIEEYEITRLYQQGCNWMTCTDRKHTPGT